MGAFCKAPQHVEDEDCDAARCGTATNRAGVYRRYSALSTIRAT